MNYVIHLSDCVTSGKRNTMTFELVCFLRANNYLLLNETAQ